MPFSGAQAGAGAGAGAGIGGLAGGIAGLVMGNGASKRDLELALKAWQDLKTSNFDMRSLPEPVLRVLAEQVPEVFQATTPEDFQQIEDSLQGRAAQVSALGQMGQYAQEGTPLVDRLNEQENARSVMDASSGAQAAALRSMGARGTLSGGDEIQARLAGNQTGANLGRDLAESAAKESALRRMQAVGMQGQQGAALRSGDVDVSAQKAQIANRFKELFANTMNQAGMFNAQQGTAAQAANAGNVQRIGDTNTQNQYGVNLENLNRQNRLKGDIFGQEAQKASGVAGAYGQMSDWEAAQRAEKIGNIGAIGSGVGGLVGAGAGFL